VKNRLIEIDWLNILFDRHKTKVASFTVTIRIWRKLAWTTGLREIIFLDQKTNNFETFASP
jgi:hypothetical protein